MTTLKDILRDFAGEVKNIAEVSDQSIITETEKLIDEYLQIIKDRLIGE